MIPFHRFLISLNYTLVITMFSISCYIFYRAWVISYLPFFILGFTVFILTLILLVVTIWTHLTKRRFDRNG